MLEFWLGLCYGRIYILTRSPVHVLQDFDFPDSAQRWPLLGLMTPSAQRDWVLRWASWWGRPALWQKIQFLLLGCFTELLRACTTKRRRKWNLSYRVGYYSFRSDNIWDFIVLRPVRCCSSLESGGRERVVGMSADLAVRGSNSCAGQEVSCFPDQCWPVIGFTWALTRGWSDRGVALTTNPHKVSRLRMGRDK